MFEAGLQVAVGRALPWRSFSSVAFYNATEEVKGGAWFQSGHYFCCWIWNTTLHIKGSC